ncbi:GUN4 domain-containing protein [Pycnococcus provasolii]
MSARVLTTNKHAHRYALAKRTNAPSRRTTVARRPSRVCAEETTTATATPKSVKPEQEVELKSGVGFDYAPLRDALAEGDFYKADQIHREALITVAGEEAEERGWVYFTEVRTIPKEDLLTMDNLWSAYSDGKFGFSEQRRIWLKNNKRWEKFYKAIDWTSGENNNYRKWATKEYFYTLDEACEGHLPLTNALRGTNLLEEIMLHPAFEEAAEKAGKKKSSLMGNFGQVKKLF